MIAHSKDLRQKILNCALSHSVRKTARRFQVSPNKVHLLKKLFYETGGVPRPEKARGRGLWHQNQLRLPIGRRSVEDMMVKLLFVMSVPTHCIKRSRT